MSSLNRNHEINCNFLIYKTLKIIIFSQLSQLLVVVPVVPDVLHVVGVLQHVDELLHVLHVAFAAEGDVVLRHHLDVRVDKAVSLLLFNNGKVSILVAFCPCMS